MRFPAEERCGRWEEAVRNEEAGELEVRLCGISVIHKVLLAGSEV